MPMYDFACQTCGVTKADILAKFDETLTCECGGTMTHTLATHMVTRNDIPGGLWLENYGPHPIKVYSHSERRRLLKQPRFDKTTGAEYYLTEKVEHVENPQTGKSPHTSKLVLAH
jgi:hypothetical protein